MSRRKAKDKAAEDKPYKNAPEQMGIFATRSPIRPNPIALTEWKYLLYLIGVVIGRKVWSNLLRLHGKMNLIFCMYDRRYPARHAI